MGASQQILQQQNSMEKRDSTEPSARAGEDQAAADCSAQSSHGEAEAGARSGALKTADGQCWPWSLLDIIMTKQAFLHMLSALPCPWFCRSWTNSESHGFLADVCFLCFGWNSCFGRIRLRRTARGGRFWLLNHSKHSDSITYMLRTRNPKPWINPKPNTGLGFLLTLNPWGIKIAQKPCIAWSLGPTAVMYESLDP